MSTPAELTPAQSAAVAYVTAAEAEAARVPELDGISPRAIERIVIVGGGAMGAGIAVACAEAGFETAIVERADRAFDRPACLQHATFIGSGGLVVGFDPTITSPLLTMWIVEILLLAQLLDALDDALGVEAARARADPKRKRAAAVAVGQRLLGAAVSPVRWLDL